MTSQYYREAVMAARKLAKADAEGSGRVAAQVNNLLDVMLNGEPSDVETATAQLKVLLGTLGGRL